MTILPATLCDMTRRRAVDSPARDAYVYLHHGETEACRVTYAGLDAAARALAAALRTTLPSRRPVAILCPHDHTFPMAFIGALYADAIAVPLWVPGSAAEMTHVAAMLADAGPACIVTSSAALERLRALAARVDAARAVENPSHPALSALPWLAVDALPSTGWRPDETASSSGACYLQYTSGSTSTPKGVMIGHRNVLSNLEAIDADFRHDADAVSVSWLPYFHDMGLVYGMLAPIRYGFLSVQMAPAAFAQRPLRWLEAMSRYRATHGGGPNFAYDLCARRAGADTAGLDLRAWRVAFSGGEPVRSGTLRRFADAFAANGFDDGALYPAYGLAEATLKVTGGWWRDRGRNRPGHGADESAVACGRPAGNTTVRIVDPETRTPRADTEVGEIWVAGDGIAGGYWRRDAETAATFKASIDPDDGASYLRTGDLGYVRDGVLTVTGRMKDLIILRGRNYHPEDLEHAIAGCHDGLRPHSTAAFHAAFDEDDALVVVQEVRRHAEGQCGAIVRVLRGALSEHHGVSPRAVVLIREGSIPKTTSGKIRRQECRMRYLRGELDILVTDVEMLAAGAAPPPADRDWRGRLTASSGSARAAVIAEFLQDALAALNGGAANDYPPSTAVNAAGLDSLRAADLRARIETQLQIPSSVSELLSDLTVMELAESLASRPDQAESHAAVASTHALSASQQALWHLQRLEPDRPFLNIGGALRLRGPVDADRVHAAFATIVRRHDSLRDRFVERDGAPERITGDAPLDFEVSSCAGWSEAQLGAWVSREFNRTFDLTRGAFRVRVGTIGEREALLLLVAHHLVVDLWSWTLLLNEFEQLYDAPATRPTTLPPSPPLARSSSYAAAIAAEARMLAGARGSELTAYWRDRVPDSLDPCIFPAPIEASGERLDGVSVPFQLDRETTGAIRRQCRERGVTLYTFLLAAAAVLLRAYRAGPIAIGSPAANRRHGEFHGTVGQFVNPLVFVTDLDGNPRFGEYLRALRADVLSALDRQELPYSTLVERVRPRRNAGRSPLFQVLFAVQTVPPAVPRALALLALNRSGPAGWLGPFAVDSMRIEPVAPQFDVAFNVVDGADGVDGADDAEIAGTLDARAPVLDADRTALLARQYVALLARIAADPDQPVLSLASAAAAQHASLIAGWNATGHDLPEATLIDLIDAQAARTPEAIAASFDGETLTYGRLSAAANQLARLLITRGAGPETIVAVALERSLDLLVALVAIGKTGAAYLPIDLDDPPARLGAVFTDARPVCVVTVARVDARLPDAGSPSHVCLDDEAVAADLRRMSAANVVDAERTSRLEPEHPLYVIYTSGSTGAPKAVINTHQGLVNRILWMQAAYRLDASDRVLQKTPYTFDVSVWELFWPIICGAAVVFLEPDRHRDSQYLAEAIARAEITTVHFVPSMLRGVIERLPGEGWPALRRIICSGEALSGDLQARVVERLPDVMLANLYGPTEAAIDVTAWTCRASDGDRTPPIGAPIWNTRTYVLDDLFDAVLIGAAGELYLTGVGLARGYLRRPSLTAERFLPDPFGPPGSRMYRTGDRARWRADGTLDFLGRLDRQVKVRGHRIELAEIERTLRAHPAIEDAVVVVDTRERDDIGLIAYVRTTERTAAPERELRKWMGERLPRAMTPRAVVTVGAWPLTTSGKIDLAQLPEPSREQEPAFAQDGGYIAPRNDVESRIAAIWSELLHIDRPGVEDSFFDAGGHSLIAGELASRVGRAFDVSIQLTDIFRSLDTIERLAARVVELSGNRAACLPSGTTP